MYGNTRVNIESLPHLLLVLNHPLDIKSFFNSDLCRFAAFSSLGCTRVCNCTLCLQLRSPMVGMPLPRLAWPWAHPFELQLVATWLCMCVHIFKTTLLTMLYAMFCAMFCAMFYVVLYVVLHAMLHAIVHNTLENTYKDKGAFRFDYFVILLHICIQLVIGRLCTSIQLVSGRLFLIK